MGKITTEFLKVGNGAPTFNLTLGEEYLDQLNNVKYIGTASGNVSRGLLDVVIYRSLTHAQLLAAIAASSLVVGESIRITDYVTTTVQVDTVSAGHAFDLVVTAIAPNAISENAKAVLHDGDTYFAGRANLSAWDIKYTPFNDTVKFAWADDTDGKGVIYFMRDEYGNECPYDFKNIQFARTAGGVVPQTDNYFTFSWVNDDDVVEDLSLIGNTLLNDEGSISGVYGNKIGILSGLNLGTTILQYLSKNCFISSYAYIDGYFFGCYSNTFGNNCYSNTFGNNCSSITFGNDCHSNTFGNDCHSNTFGNYCLSNTFGNNCYSNTFGNNCSSNTFGNDCRSNTFGNDCSSNTSGNYCHSNTFGNNCSFNAFGNNCYSNTFGATCQFNTFIKTAHNFTSVTELYNKNYPHEVIGCVGGKELVRWYDSSGDLQTLVVT